MAPYKVFNNALTGLMTGTFTNGLVPVYKTYEFLLTQTPNFFHQPDDVQGYNEKYPKAVAIFANTAQGMALRLGLQAAFAATFTDTANNTKRGDASTGAEFVQIVQHERHGYRRLFDFSLTLEGIWRIAEANIWGARDMASKHSVLSRGAEKLFYAGTLTFLDGALVITNDSGTYAPRTENLTKLKMLLEAEFTGLTVIALTQDDPQYKALHEDRTYTVQETMTHIPAIIGGVQLPQLPALLPGPTRKDSLTP